MFWRSNFAYYLSLFLPIIVNGLIFFLIFSGATNDQIEGLGDALIYWLKFFWFAGIVIAASNFIGLIYFGNPEKQNRKAIEKFARTGWTPPNFLVVVYVSRGDNVHALGRSILATKSLLDANRVDYRIDVVTDLPVQEEISRITQDVTFHLVPEGYTTINNAKWKARALHYVVERHGGDNNFNDKNTWILHLDEESQITQNSLAGIAEFISDPKNRDCVGQGEIKYNAHKYGEDLLITWVDSIRSGDDLGRFRFQFGLFSKPLFGMHGSYILAPLHIEQRFGFDLGRRGSVTEDAYFALKCADEGIKFRWVNGYIKEQSPYNLKAIAKQRRRWFCGLLSLSFDSEIRLSTRLPLMINTLLWSIAWLGPVVTVLALIFGGYFPLPLLITALLMQGFYASTYMIGAMRNIADVENQLSMMKKLKIYLGTLVGVHVASIIEGASVLYAITRPVKTFDVVNKN